MQTLSKALAGLILSLTVTCCNNVQHTPSHIVIQGDTLKVETITKGDTVFEKGTWLDKRQEENFMDTSIYSQKRIDTTIVKSNFFFQYKDFKIYFDKQKVIAYCDSVIKVTPPHKEGEDYVNWGITNSMEQLRKQAQSDKEMEEELADWLPGLLERFNPLVVSISKNQSLKFLLRKKFLSKTYGYRDYFSINRQGDTALLAGEQDYLELQEVTNQNGM